MKGATGKILLAILVVFIVAYVVYQAWGYIYDPYKTEIAYNCSVQDSVLCKGVFVREEKVYDTDYTGILDYTCESGEMISSGGEIGRVYSSQEDIDNIEKAEKLGDEIEILRKARVRGENYLSLGGEITSEIDELVHGTVRNSWNGDVDGLGSIREKISVALNAKTVITDGTEWIDQRISELEKELEETEDKISAPLKKLKMSEKGYFVAYSDGYEYLNSETVAGYGVEDFEKITDDHIKRTSAIGKVVTSYRWNYAAIIPKDSEGKFTVGTEISVDFGISGLEWIPMKVESVISGEGGESVVILGSDYISGEIFKLRTHSARLIFKTVTGLRVPENALRMVGGKSGVYILKKTVVRYRTVETLYKGTGYYIVKWDPYDSEGIQLFDEVFVEGRDLYEGKQIGENKI